MIATDVHCGERDRLEADWQASRHSEIKARGRLYNFASTARSRKRASERLAEAERTTSYFFTQLQEHRRVHGC